MNSVSSRNLWHPNVPLNISRIIGITVRYALSCGKRGNVVYVVYVVYVV